MKKYTILALALALCVTCLSGCRRNKGIADGTIPTTAMTTAPTTHATTVPTTVPSTTFTTVPATTELRPDVTTAPQDNMTDTTTPNSKSRSRTVMPGVG